jgi:hypothetical protein
MMIDPLRRYWCPVCATFVLMVEEEPHEVELASGGKASGGDVVCAACGYVALAFVVAES